MEIREEIKSFAEAMERKLAKYDEQKDGWEDCSPEYLVARLAFEFAELISQLNQTKEQQWEDDNVDFLISECADVGNFAMMIADVAHHKRKCFKEVCLSCGNAIHGTKYTLGGKVFCRDCVHSGKSEGDN